MSAIAINQVRIYNAALSEDQVQQRAADVVRLLALGLVRSLGKRPAQQSSHEPIAADRQEPTLGSGSGEIR
ncbi:MAG: hypothetical protein P9M14_03625 [Candidatus Alcyoniella australis]|nr:hypothetical protein [Candidatus Alcyoniella australis]